MQEKVSLAKKQTASKHNNHVAGEMFAVIIEDRTANTLLPLIRKHIAPGSIIISDKWKPYNNIKEMKDCLFEHHSVNHSKTFKDPETGACTNLIEGAWRAHLKSKISVQNYRKFQLGKYIHRRMWTKKNEHRLWDSIWEVLADIDYDQDISNLRASKGGNWIDEGLPKHEARTKQDLEQKKWHNDYLERKAKKIKREEMREARKVKKAKQELQRDEDQIGRKIKIVGEDFWFGKGPRKWTVSWI